MGSNRPMALAFAQKALDGLGGLNGRSREALGA
jgi:hypothetical protein